MSATAAAFSCLRPRIRSRRCGKSADRSVVVRAALDNAEPTEKKKTKQVGSFTFLPAEPSEWDDDSNGFRFKKPEGVARVTAPPGAPPIVILPGFGNDSGDYLAPFGEEDASIVAALRARGWDVHVVQLERKDWTKILRAVLSKGHGRPTSMHPTSIPHFSFHFRPLFKRAFNTTPAVHPHGTRTRIMHPSLSHPVEAF